MCDVMGKSRQTSRCFRRRRGLLVCLVFLASVECAPKKQNTAKAAVNHVVRDLHAVPFEKRMTETSFVSEDRRLEVVFLDLGDDVGLILRADGNTLLHVDTDQDGRPTPGTDRSFGVDFGTGAVCSWYVDSDPSRCTETKTNARAAIGGKDDRREISLRIPKSELGQSRTDSWVVFEIYSGSSGDGPRRYPQFEFFQKVYRLVYSRSARAMGVSDNWPGPTTAAPSDELKLHQPHLVSFGANPRSIYLGEQVCLDWDVPNVQKVTIDPGFGEFDAKGRQCFNPDKPMTIMLRAKGTDGTIERTERIQLKDVEIDSFEALPKKIRLGGSFSLEWHVKGATSLGLERIGSAQNSGSTFDASVTSSNTKIRVNATKKEFEKPGHYTYKLKA